MGSIEDIAIIQATNSFLNSYNPYSYYPTYPYYPYGDPTPTIWSSY
jgi:hypothetical protein